ncbi:MAG: alpha/beta hydrolase [Bacteroidaceae bacterium]|nr:alpha/beta hydrolase [Bacteroidaceae bacterium]
MIKTDTICGKNFVMDYSRFGDGERTMVLIPGVSLLPVTPLVDFIARQYAVMTEDFTIYLFDRKRDISNSYTVEEMADDTAEAMRMLGLKDAYLYGCSQGGMIAQVIAARYPELVARLAVCSTMASIGDVTAPTLNEWSSYAAAGDMLSFVRSFHNAVYSEAHRRSHPKLLKQMEMIVPKIDAVRVRQLVDACLAFDATALLPFIRCATLVIASEQDEVLGVEPSRRLAEALACRLVIYPSSGHAVFDEVPEVLLQVREFFLEADSRKPR